VTDETIYIQRVYEKRTYRSIGEEHGISEQKAYLAYLRQRTKEKRKWEIMSYWDAPLTDPDGIIEFEDEWTVEEQYAEIYK
jgi:hypothetical protein